MLCAWFDLSYDDAAAVVGFGQAVRGDLVGSELAAEAGREPDAAEADGEAGRAAVGHARLDAGNQLDLLSGGGVEVDRLPDPGVQRITGRLIG